MAGETYNENSDVLAILFDLDNTLIQTRNGDSRACNKLLKCSCTVQHDEQSIRFLVNMAR
ncbi:hypothetical protein MSG28_006994 [Choristoneura fumiferana]|uniref:Uncharacterized protein n=1 Tax=Choristoneura fumiferana TaxID=7141 RepID=A0ACC0JLY7_CHOFU|nr:hypothetical protein MSG28_006994 [Choristoneura fumiferana]